MNHTTFFFFFIAVFLLKECINVLQGMATDQVQSEPSASLEAIIGSRFKTVIAFEDLSHRPICSQLASVQIFLKHN